MDEIRQHPPAIRRMRLLGVQGNQTKTEPPKMGGPDSSRCKVVHDRRCLFPSFKVTKLRPLHWISNKSLPSCRNFFLHQKPQTYCNDKHEDAGVGTRGPQVLAFVSVCQGNPFWGYPIFTRTHVLFCFLDPPTSLSKPRIARFQPSTEEPLCEETQIESSCRREAAAAYFLGDCVPLMCPSASAACKFRESPMPQQFNCHPG